MNCGDLPRSVAPRRRAAATAIALVSALLAPVVAVVATPLAASAAVGAPACVEAISIPSGQTPDGDGVFSPTGRYVLIADLRPAPNRYPASVGDLYLRDRQAGTSTKVNTTSAGVEFTGAIRPVAVTTDALRILFLSNAEVLGTGPDQYMPYLFTKDLQTGTVTKLGAVPNGWQPSVQSAGAGGLADSGLVAFSTTDALVPADTDTGPDAYTYDPASNTFAMLAAGRARSTAGANAISNDGRYVTFLASAVGDAGTEGIDGRPVLVDRTAGTLVELAATASQATLIAGDGSRLVWANEGLVVVDRATMQSTSPVLPYGVSPGVLMSISRSGRYLTFSSYVIDLVTGRVNPLVNNGLWATVDDDADLMTIDYNTIDRPLLLQRVDRVRELSIYLTANPLDRDFAQGETAAVSVFTHSIDPLTTTLALGPGVTLSNLVSIGNNWNYTATLSVATGAPLGARTATVTNANGCVTTFASALNVEDGRPTVSTLVPTGARTSTTTNVQITGSRLDAVTSVSFGNGTTVNSLTHDSASRLTASVTVAPSAAGGLRDVVVTAPAGTATLPAAFTVQTPEGEFHALAPSRILDTRTGTGGRTGPLGPGGTFDLTVLGVGAVPSTGVSAVVLNVTATEPTSNGYVTVWPTGSSAPTASSLNVSPGVTRPNLVTAKVGAGGKVSILNSAGSTHITADVAGWYGTGAAPDGARLEPIGPFRYFDSRYDSEYPIDGGGIRLGFDGIGSDVTAVMLNVTVTEPTASAFLTAYPSDQAMPVASNLNFSPGQTVPNMVIVPLSAAGEFDVVVSNGTAEVIIDIVGVFSTDGGVALTPMTPTRFLDTRDNTGGHGTSPMSPGGRIDLQVSGINGVPAGASVVLANVTVTGPTASGFITTWAAGEPQPLASSLNFTPGLTAPNLVAIPVGADGRISILNSAGSTHVIVDVVGWYR